MNKLHTYEDAIREKLDSLSAPDTTGLWESMEAILEKEMPRQEKKRRVGFFALNSKPVLIAASILVLLGGTYAFNQFSASKAIATREEQTTPASALPSEPAAAETPVEEAIRRGNDRKILVQESTTVSSSANIKNNQSAIKPVKSSTPVVVADQFSVTGTTTREVTTETSASSLTEETATGINRPAVDPLSGNLTAAEVELQPLHVSDFALSYPEPKKAASLADDGLTLGFSLNFPLAVGTQKKLDLDMAGQKNSWMDYLPSIYMQYHLNRKMYVQAEVQPGAPQYSPNLTLYHRIDSLNPDEKDEKFVKLDKLFYFNLPVSFHYSPVKNLYIGAGVQYSRLQRIILQDQEYHHTWSLWPNIGEWTTEETKNEVVVKDPAFLRRHSTNDVADSVANSFKKQEFRLLADVNYTYKGFSLGMRYTKGMGNYVNSNFTNLPVKDKNQSLQVYLRYNIFDGRKR